VRDADLVLDLERRHRLAASDLGGVSEEWLNVLAPALQSGERVARQRLRIARLPLHAVHYRVGSERAHAVFTGHELAAPSPAASAAFAARASRLHGIALLLAAAGALFTLVSLGRGTFYWSVATLFSILAFAATLAAVYAAACDWTAARRNFRRWLAAAAASLLVSTACAVAALPRLSRAEDLIARERLDTAEAELRALGEAAPAHTWADLHVARVRRATDVDDARTALMQIPRELPQYAAAVAATDALILKHVERNVREGSWTAGAHSLALLSDGGRRSPDGVQRATDVYVPLARRHVQRSDWPAAADTLRQAREFGVAPAALEPPTRNIREAALQAATAAKRERNAAGRLRLRIEAEAILVAWEQAAGLWGTRALIDLRRDMARDVAAAEKAARRRR